MNQYVKTIIGTGIAILCIFAVFYFFGKGFVSSVSPVTEVSNNLVPIEADIQIGKKLPNFDLALFSGGRIRNFDNENKANVIVFWSTWNSISTDQIKILDDYLSDQEIIKKNLPVRIIAINSQETEAAAANFIRRGGYSVSTAFDTSGEVSALYGIKTVPTLFFTNKEGVLISSYVGIMNKEALVNNIEKIIK